MESIEPDDAIRTVVMRLSRPHRSGGEVIERAAILAEGSSSSDVLRWIAAHGGEPESAAPSPSRGGGLHGARTATGVRPPQRYVLPPGALTG